MRPETYAESHGARRVHGRRTKDRNDTVRALADDRCHDR
ncbi:hypothetical protein BURMUCF1_2793 [Burkholderia multivorans ATCC BAA-247]|nr:hypothetical protein BURMUCGD2M_0787 [Burkholderia multivorans CGD2M]EJO53574.1 hypothetical protein BURMUCF1_2793 [Burkholderia multivorans ATCC BAA-247]